MQPMTDDQHEELKPCPYCGGQPSVFWKGAKTVAFIVCGDCPVNVEDRHLNYEELRTVWNGLPRRRDDE